MKTAIIYSDAMQPADMLQRLEERDKCLTEIKASLVSLGHEVVCIPAMNGFFDELKKRKGDIDLVFNLADEGYEFKSQLEAQIPAVLDIMGIPYTGSNYLCLGNCIDKVRTKQLLQAAGIPTPKYAVFNKRLSKETDISGLEFPLIVKPAREHGSIGIEADSVVDNRESLVKKVNEVHRDFDEHVIAEEFIEGRELNVGILGRSKPTALPIAEIIFTLPPDKKRFLPYEAKWKYDSEYYSCTTPKCPAELNNRLKNTLEKIAQNAYKWMGIWDYGRVDIRIGEDGQIYVIDVNPNPDISSDAGLARMAMAKGMTYTDIIGEIVKTACEEK